MLDEVFLRRTRETCVVLFKEAAAKLTGVPELDVPETLGQRMFGGWRDPSGREADIPFDYAMDALEAWDKHDRRISRGFAKKFPGQDEADAAALLSGSLERGEDRASLAREDAYADEMANWRDRTERGLGPAAKGWLGGNSRRYNRAYSRKLDAEDAKYRDAAAADSKGRSEILKAVLKSRGEFGGSDPWRWLGSDELANVLRAGGHGLAASDLRKQLRYKNSKRYWRDAIASARENMAMTDDPVLLSRQRAEIAAFKRELDSLTSRKVAG